MYIWVSSALQKDLVVAGCCKVSLTVQRVVPAGMDWVPLGRGDVSKLTTVLS